MSLRHGEQDRQRMLLSVDVLHADGRPVSALRAHALELARSQGGDRNELPHQMWILKPQQSFNQVRFSLGWPRMASDGL